MHASGPLNAVFLFALTSNVWHGANRGGMRWQARRRESRTTHHERDAGGARLQGVEGRTVVRALCEPRRNHGKDRLLHLRLFPADKVSAGGGLKEEGEDIDVIETTLEEAAAMIASGEIVDAKTVVLVQYLINRMQAAACS